MRKFALRLASLIFLLVSLAHFYRYYEKIQVVINHYSIPLSWSLYAGFGFLVLAIFMHMAMRR